MKPLHKAVGLDNIPNWILKDFSYILAAPIAAIYNSSVRQSYVPPSWKQVEILPIPKVSQVTSLARRLRHIALPPVGVQGAGVVCLVPDETSNSAQ